MISLSAGFIGRQPAWAVFWRVRHKVIAFVCISSKILLIHFKCVYNRSHLCSPQSYRCTPRWNATEAFRFSAKVKKKVHAKVTSQDSDRLRSQWSLVVCPAYQVVLPGCLVHKQRPRLATELAKLVLFSLWRSERQKGEFCNRLWSGTGVCVSLTAVITVSWNVLHCKSVVERWQ
jgi:hypothetical protein